MTAKADFRKVITKIDMAVNQAYKATVADVGTEIIDYTPVDKYDMKNAWNFSKDGSSIPFIPSPEGYRDNTNSDGDISLARMEKHIGSIKRSDPDKITYILNNADYATMIEYGEYSTKSETGKVTEEGFSFQAPKGIIENSERLSIYKNLADKAVKLQMDKVK